MASAQRAQPIWQPRPNCRDYKWFDFRDSLRCLAGRALVFEGDSTVRQLFLRLIWWLRGVPQLVEHYFHQGAIYVFNETHDELRPVGRSLSQWWKTGTREQAAETWLFGALYIIRCLALPSRMLIAWRRPARSKFRAFH